MDSAGGACGAKRHLFDFIYHDKEKYYSRAEASSAPRRSIDSDRLTPLTHHFDQLYAYLPAGVFTAASTGGGVDCAIIRRCAYGMIVVNRSTWLSSDLPRPLSRPIMRPTSSTSAGTSTTGFALIARGSSSLNCSMRSLSA